jgi:hypothetical protein
MGYLIIRNSRSPLSIATFLFLAFATNSTHASCNDRPGTPDQVKAIALPIKPFRTTPSIELSWRNTTRRGLFATPGGYFDVSVTNTESRSIGHHDVTGGAFQRNDFGTRGHLEIGGLPANTTLCFKIKARTEGGTQGCVSHEWSERVCETTVGAPSFGPVGRPDAPGTGSCGPRWFRGGDGKCHPQLN